MSAESVGTAEFECLGREVPSERWRGATALRIYERLACRNDQGRLLSIVVYAHVHYGQLLSKTREISMVSRPSRPDNRRT